MLSHAFSVMKLNGLGFSDLASKSAPAFKYTPTSSLVIFPAVTRILNTMTKMYEVLSFSNNPRFTYLYTWKVKYFMMISTLFDGSCTFSDSSIEPSNNFKNYSREELYIQSILAISMMQKYNADPLMATGLYYSLFSLISLVFISASTNLTATSLAYVLVWFKTSISSVSSNKFPEAYVSLSSRFLSNLIRSFLLKLTSKSN